MNPSMHRIIITEKGRELQNGILNQPSHPPKLSTPRESVSIQGVNNLLSPTLPYTCRTGYFRSKEKTHAILKTSASNRIYPNYLKRDPREYPMKHQCVWDPIPTINGTKSIPSAFPTTKTVHHAFFDPENVIDTQALTIKDFNSAVGGQNDLTVNLTACHYPEYHKVETPNQTNRMGGDSGLADSLASMGQTKGWTFGKRSSSDGMILVNGKPKSKNAGFKLPFNKLGNSSFMNSEAMTQRLGMTSPGGGREELLSSYAWKTHRDANKLNEEKVILAFKKHNQKQKDYLNLLDRMDKKMKDKLLTKLESPEYMPGFENKLKQGREWLDSERTKDMRETARYKERVKSFGESKYGKTWEKTDDFSKKTAQGSLKGSVDLSKMTDEIRKDSLVLSQGRGARTARSSEISQVFRQSIELNLESQNV